MFEIREIRPDEYAFLREMLYEAIYFPDESEKPPRSIIDEPHLAKYIDGFGRAGDLAFVLLKDNELSGAIWVRQFSAVEKSYGFVDEATPELSMAIGKDLRGRGFGTQLIGKICGILKSKGVGKLSLSVDKQNPAVNLYKRSGFEIIGEQGTAYTMLKNVQGEF